jgi:hypothetical protein
MLVDMTMYKDDPEELARMLQHTEGIGYVSVVHPVTNRRIILLMIHRGKDE